MKKYAIIIPTLNEAQGIVAFLEPLQSLRMQCEIIIADGGSTDATASLAQASIDLFLTCDKKGRASQMNQGAKHASAEILIFLHADTFLPESASFMMNWRSRLSGIATGDQAIFVSKSSFDAVGAYPEIALMEDIVLSKQLKKITAPYCIQQTVQSSARRWESFGIGRTILLMWYLRLRYFLGTPPKELAALYRQGRFK